jgi:uncharacterized membrane protein
MRIASAGHAFFGATMIIVGILGLIKGDYTAVWQPVAKDVPASTLLIYLCAFISVASGLGLFWNRTASVAGRLLFGYLLFWLLVFGVPSLVRGLTVDAYWSLCKTGAILAAAWVLYVWFAANWDKEHLSFVTGNTGLRVARVFYGLAIIPFGVAHFQYLEHTASMVPDWLPAHLAWAYFTGATFIVAGMAILIGVCARLAAALSTLQMGIFFVLVWIPAMATHSLNKFQWGEVLVTWVLTSAGWVVADSYRNVPWLAGLRARLEAVEDDPL